MAGRFDMSGRTTVLTRLQEIERVILDDFGLDVVKDARARAPVRKIFKQKRRKYRDASTVKNYDFIKTALAHYKAQLRSSGYGSGPVKVRRGSNKALKIGGTRTISIKHRTERGESTFIRQQRFFSAQGVGARAHHRVSKPDFYNRNKEGFIQAYKTQSGFTTNEATDAKLSPRGRYEVRSGRAAVESESGKIQIGGRLKKSIVAEGAYREGHRTINSIGTDVPYALFVEFPTSHNAAQPFLLPALHGQKRNLLPRLEDALREAGLKKG
jgi:hypothetical protein